MRVGESARGLVWVALPCALLACGQQAPGSTGMAGGGITAGVSGGADEGDTEDGADGKADDPDPTGEGTGGSEDPTSDSADTDDAPKFDLGEAPEGEPDCGQVGDGGGALSFSYIWIANSSQGTVSKIDTQTGVEEGRYRTSTDASASPSRTSVNQFGDVAVGNRNGDGRINKIAADPDDCIDGNGTPGIQTSTGSGDILDFGTDECLLWSTPLPVADYGPRAIAWEGGKVDPQTCENTVPNPRLWVGYGGASREIYRLDGDSGAVLDHVTVPGGGGYVYGGGVDGDGNFWMVTRGAQQLTFVDATTLAYTNHAIPGNPYGMGVDENGDPWVVTYSGGPGADHVYRFDNASQSFVDAGGANGYYRGMNLDREGRNWVAGNNPCRLAAFDVATDSLIADDIALPGCTTPVGVSIDFDGFVWVVDQNGTAFKVHPDNYTIEFTVGGLVGPYTYSDMTGAGLNLVVNPPG